MTLIDRAQPIVRKLELGSWLPLLLLRLFLGYFFFVTGLAHLKNLDSVTKYFISLDIPMPAFNAALSTGTELIGGGLFMLGALTRLVSIPLFINMVVATLTAKLKKVAGLGDFVELSEPLYALVFFLYIFSGPGKASVDHAIMLATRKPAALPPRATM